MPDRQRLLSALIALYYVTAMWRREGWGWARRRIDRPTPLLAIRLLGWVLLLTPAIIIIVQRLRAP